MLKKVVVIVLVLSLTACSEIFKVAESITGQSQSLSQQQIGMGLKEALTNGITKQVVGLAKPNGFLNDQMVKIMYPAQLKKVEKTLRDIGMGSLADKGLELLNKAAERAVGEAIPIFKQAIVNMSFADASKILMGDKNAATQYLKQTTENSLRAKFTPIIQNSLEKVGADRVWNNIISTYNKIPLVDKVNPNLTEYTTNVALQGVFKKVAVEEEKIRTNVGSRSTDLLKKVFALQDK